MSNEVESAHRPQRPTSTAGGARWLRSGMRRQELTQPGALVQQRKVFFACLTELLQSSLGFCKLPLNLCVGNARLLAARARAQLGEEVPHDLGQYRIAKKVLCVALSFESTKTNTPSVLFIMVLASCQE